MGAREGHFKAGSGLPGAAAKQHARGGQQVVKLVPEQEEDFHRLGGAAGYLPDSGSQEVRTLSAQLL